MTLYKTSYCTSIPSVKFGFQSILGNWRKNTETKSSLEKYFLKVTLTSKSIGKFLSYIMYIVYFPSVKVSFQSIKIQE